jgi:hypothetical protein
MKLIAIIFTLSLLGWGTTRIVKNVQFDIECEGHLNLAANANTIEIASSELCIALEYLREQGLTKGYTSIVYNTPNEDIGFWYNNLKESHNELLSISDSASALEKSNVLIKLRETLIGHSENGEYITKPYGISIAPNNVVFFWWGIGSLIGMIGFWFKALGKYWKI